MGWKREQNRAASKEGLCEGRGEGDESMMNGF